MDTLEKKKYKVWIILALVILACFLTYYFQHVLKSRQLYTHFFYIPIILSCLWWKRKGLYVTAVLLGVLILSQTVYFHYRIDSNDYVRALMLVFISLITVFLSERLFKAKEQLLETETRYQTIFETTGTAMVIIEENAVISLANAEFATLSGYAKEEIENKKSPLEFVPKEEQEKIRAYHYARRTSPETIPRQYEFKFLTKHNQQRDVLATVDMIPGTGKSVASLSDITELKQTLIKQKELQGELSTALAKVLSGYIPICANCKKIRDEENNWVQIESYISEKTAADFSHGICPQCAKLLYSEYLPDVSQNGSG